MNWWLSLSLTSQVIVGWLLVSVVGLGAFDLWTIMTRGVDASISETINRAAHINPLIPAMTGLALGMLFVHLFSPRN